MEQEKCKRGRPKIDAHITEEFAPSRRQALNKTYMYEAVYFISEVAAEIQNGDLLWKENPTAGTVISRDGILEQLGRMILQDKLSRADCVYLTNLAAAAVKRGYTTREVELALREVRMAAKQSLRSPESKTLYRYLGGVVNKLRWMGGHL